MPRPPRIEFAGALYHVMSRGNERRQIVRDDADRHERLEWLRRTVATYGWRLHAFVLMLNHEHLFVETAQPNLSMGMQYLNGSYAGYFNRRHARVGHLFQGRFKALLVERAGYFLELSRYLHLNPNRAGIADRPEDYPWSSYPGYHRVSRTLPWVTYEDVLGEFARDMNKARQAYRRFVRAGLTNPPPIPWRDAAGDLIIGSAGFVEQIRNTLSDRTLHSGLAELEKIQAQPALERIAAVVAKEFNGAKTLWTPGRRASDLSRAVVAYLARGRFGYPSRLVAQLVGYSHTSSVPKAVRRIAQSRDSALGAKIRRLEQQLADI